MRQTSKILLFILTTVGFIYGLKLSYDTWMQISPCPSLGVIPACYLVTIGYLLMILSLISTSKITFYLGWFTVFLLAFVGSALETTFHNVCPRLENGLPMCYISLSITLLLLLFYRFHLRSSNGN